MCFLIINQCRQLRRFYFIINHHEEHEGFFIYLRSLRDLRGKNMEQISYGT